VAHTLESLPESAVSRDLDGLRRRTRILGSLVVVLALAVIGLGSWILVSDPPVQDLTPVQETMLDTIDTYIEGWNAGDAEAVVSVMDPNGFLQDIGGRWEVADGALANYVNSLHMMGMRIWPGDAYVIGPVVLVDHHYAEQSTTPGPNIYFMSADGTRILWAMEPWPSP
jgi:hypothetical protein